MGGIPEVSPVHGDAPALRLTRELGSKFWWWVIEIAQPPPEPGSQNRVSPGIAPTQMVPGQKAVVGLSLPWAAITCTATVGPDVILPKERH